MQNILRLLTALAAVSLLGPMAAAASDRADERARLVEEVRQDIAGMPAAVGVEALSPAVVDALLAVRRHAFVPGEYADDAYRNRPLWRRVDIYRGCPKVGRHSGTSGVCTSMGTQRR